MPKVDFSVEVCCDVVAVAGVWKGTKGGFGCLRTCLLFLFGNLAVAVTAHARGNLQGKTGHWYVCKMQEKKDSSAGDTSRRRPKSAAVVTWTLA